MMTGTCWSQAMLHMLVVLLPAILGCAASRASAPVLAAAPPTRTENRQPFLTIDQIRGGLGDLPVWPFAQRDFSPREWLRIVEFAYRLQQTDADTVLAALREYVHVPNDEDPGKHVGEWSKVYILLRVLFDVPSDRYDKRKHALPLLSGGGFTPAYRSRREYSRLCTVLSRPVLWTEEGPHLFSSLAGYSGPPYDVDYEWSRYQGHYRYRDLEGVLRMLRVRIAAQTQSAPASGPTR